MTMLLLYRSVTSKSKQCENCQRKIFPAYTRKPQGFRVRGVLVWVEESGEVHKCQLVSAKQKKPDKSETQSEFDF